MTSQLLEELASPSVSLPPATTTKNDSFKGPLQKKKAPSKDVIFTEDKGPANYSKPEKYPQYTQSRSALGLKSKNRITPKQKREMINEKVEKELEQEALVVTPKVTKILGEDLVQELKERHERNKKRKAQIQEKVSQNILWQPHPGPQTQFLSSTEYEVGFFGGRGSGKSDCLIVDPLRFVKNPNFKGLLIRRTMPALREIISRAKQLYPKMYPGTKWKEQEKIFEFPSGAVIEFGYFDHPDDYDRYHGREFAWLGIDEITQYPDKEYYDKIKSVVRSTDKALQPRIRCTCNPSGPGRIWVKDYFKVGEIQSNVPQYEEIRITDTEVVKLGKKYIISTVYDNPSAVENDPQYIAYLQSLPEIQRRQWLEGDFEASDGIAFEDFNKKTHVVAPFAIPATWTKIRSIDWGYRSKAVAIWVAIDPDHNAYVYREYVTSQVTADIFAANALQLENNEFVQYGIIDGSVGDQRGISGPTIDEEMRKVGLVSVYADKGKYSRIHGKMLIHKYLRIDPITNQPKLKIFNTCPQMIKELSSLMVDPNNSEDVNTRMEDHAYDALRYALSSRPDPYAGSYSKGFGDSSSKRFNEFPVIVNSIFGY